MLAAGTQTKFKTKDDADFTPLPGMLAIGQVGEKNPVLDQTTLEDTAKRSMAGMFDGPEKEFKCMSYPTDAGQRLFIAAAQATKTVIVQHIWPDNVTAEYEVVLLGYLRNETRVTRPLISWCRANRTARPSGARWGGRCIMAAKKKPSVTAALLLNKLSLRQGACLFRAGRKKPKSSCVKCRCPSCWSTRSPTSTG